MIPERHNGMTITSDDVDRMDERGFVTWASTEEDGGPDVGITIGLGPEVGHLWFGEITRQRYESEGCDEYADSDMGWWLLHYKPKGEPTVIGKLLSDSYTAREFFEHTLAPLLGAAIAAIPGGVEVLSPEDYDALKASLENPPAPNDRLRALLAGERERALEAALRGILENIEEDCGEPDCGECGPWREARRALAMPPSKRRAAAYIESSLPRDENQNG